MLETSTVQKTIQQSAHQSTQPRKTKIIATIGPASDSVDTLEKLMQAGLNVVRLNLSHGNYDEHAERVARVRQAASNLGMHIAIMVDTKGIEVRTGLLSDGPVTLEAGAPFRSMQTKEQEIRPVCQ